MRYRQGCISAKKTRSKILEGFEEILLGVFIFYFFFKKKRTELAATEEDKDKYLWDLIVWGHQQFNFPILLQGTTCLSPEMTGHPYMKFPEGAALASPSPGFSFSDSNEKPTR